MCGSSLDCRKAQNPWGFWRPAVTHTQGGTVTMRRMPKYQFDVEVLPEYLPEQSAPDTGVFSFAYTITITNAGDAPGQLISRHWIISDARGHTEEVKGLGVVGQQPLLKPGESFQYTSGCRLRPPAAPCTAPSIAWPRTASRSTRPCPCLCWRRSATARPANP